MAYSNKKDSLLLNFIQHLGSLGVSKNTLKNYQSDIVFFCNWAFFKLKETGVFVESFTETIPFLSPELVKEFRKTQSLQIHSQNTVNRRLSSLRSLSRFLVETQVLESDFMEEVVNIGAKDDALGNHPLLDHFKKHLETENVSKNTVKNYISDIKHFLNWLEINQKHAAQDN